MIACSKLTVFLPPLGLLDLELVERGEPADALDDRDLARLGEAGEPAGQLLDHAVLPAAQRVDVDGGCGEADAEMAHLLGLGDHLGGVEQRLGGDAADVEADAAQGRPALDQDDLAAQVGGAEGGGVAAGAGAQHQHLGVEVALAAGWRAWASAPWQCRRRRSRGCGRLRRPGLQVQDQRALAHPVADLDLEAGHRAGGRRRHVHGRLVGSPASAAGPRP